MHHARNPSRSPVSLVISVLVFSMVLYLRIQYITILYHTYIHLYVSIYNEHMRMLIRLLLFVKGFSPWDKASYNCIVLQ